MPLVRCPDCGKRISDRAPTCIGCGRPMGEVLEEPAAETREEMFARLRDEPIDLVPPLAAPDRSWIRWMLVAIAFSVVYALIVPRRPSADPYAHALDEAHPASVLVGRAAGVVLRGVIAGGLLWLAFGRRRR